MLDNLNLCAAAGHASIELRWRVHAFSIQSCCRHVSTAMAALHSMLSQAQDACSSGLHERSLLSEASSGRISGWPHIICALSLLTTCSKQFGGTFHSTVLALDTIPSVCEGA